LEQSARGEERVEYSCSDVVRFMTERHPIVDGSMTLHGTGVDDSSTVSASFLQEQSRL
jgi:hypothetical protein